MEKSVATCEVEVPALTCNALQHEHPCQPIIPTKTGSVSSGLPRSFSQLLTDCSMDSEKGMFTVWQMPIYWAGFYARIGRYQFTE